MEDGKRAVLTKEEIIQVHTESLAGFMAPLIYGSAQRERSERGLMAPLSKKEFVVSPISEEVVEERFVISPFNPDNLDVDGIDFTVGSRIYETDLIYGKISLNKLEELVGKGGRRYDLSEGDEFVFYPGKVYYVLSQEKVKIPNDLDIIIDSKSTIGRLGCICYDVTIPFLLKNSATNLIGVVRPCYFPLKASSGKSKLFQGIFKYSMGSHMTRKELLQSGKIKIEVDGQERPIADFLDEDKLTLHFSTHRAYVSKKFSRKNLENVEPIDVDRRDIDWRKYFDEIKGDNELVLEPGRFCLFGTQEYIKFSDVCGRISRELGGHLTGLWTQFAGIIHAGFHGELTLECKTDTKRVISEGDLAGHVEVDELSKGDYNLAEFKGDYQGQKAPRLPKVFKQDK